MEHNREEFLNILLIANHLVTSDGERHPEEQKLLGQLFESMGVTAEEKERLVQKTSISKVLEEMQSFESQNLLIDILVVTASIDGNFSDDEKEFIFRVMRSIDIPPEDHPYFQKDSDIVVEQVRRHLEDLMDNIKNLSSQ